MAWTWTLSLLIVLVRRRNSIHLPAPIPEIPGIVAVPTQNAAFFGRTGARVYFVTGVGF